MKDFQKKRRESGFSLMELLIVMILMMIITAGAFQLLQGTISTANANYEMTTATQGARNAQEFLTRDILSVGDGLKGVSNLWLPTAFVTNYLTIRNAADIDPSNLGYVSIGAIISDFNLPSNVKVAGSNPQINILERTDRITMLAVDPAFSSIDIPINASNYITGQISIPPSRINDFSIGEVYYITSGGTGAFGTVTNVDKTNNSITWGEGDPIGLNRLGLSGPLASGTNINESPASLMRVNIIHYFVDAEGRLTRRAFGVKGASYIDSVIAEHVTLLKFRYILKPETAGVILAQPRDQIEISDASTVRAIEPRVIVETAYPLQDGEKHYVEAVTQVGVRNIQFLEAPVPVDASGNTTLLNPGPTPKITTTPIS
ncbi:MAG TPA: prepilin-type N-terminal cleavage/methylation domain-containing protein [Pyrinomonadaceae bacterium]|nr:prepilin-type N-terminal cleavage/methylation domain-containing protein [Pyrinomonadaceae bacterium]